MSKKSKEKITKSLLNLMETRPFSEITVAELCGDSQVSRGTFYNNFHSKEDIISQKSRAMITDYMDSFETSKKEWFKEIAYYFFDHCKGEQSYLGLLRRQNVFHLHALELIYVFSHHEKVTGQEVFQKIPQRNRDYIILAYASSSLVVYEKWATDGFQESVEEIAKIYLSIVYNLDTQL